ncbi:MAG: hypothetical protein HY748_07935 [Elusimicrobia bacterium]|nr:hypothetical protein [Elusimicrobiota bacterium]
MKKTMKWSAALAAVLVVGVIGGSLASESKDCPFAKQGASQGGGGDAPAHHAKPRRRAPLAWLFGKCFDRRQLVDGYRSVALPVKEYQLLNVRPGDFVDVLATFDANMADKRKEKMTATILQNVKVLGVVKSGDLEGRGAVHLMLNPNEAQYAALARYQGEIDIALRPEGDFALKPMEMASFRKLFAK